VKNAGDGIKQEYLSVTIYKASAIGIRREWKGFPWGLALPQTPSLPALEALLNEIITDYGYFKNNTMNKLSNLPSSRYSSTRLKYGGIWTSMCD
jgi:hypothetical protein